MSHQALLDVADISKEIANSRDLEGGNKDKIKTRSHVATLVSDEGYRDKG